MRLTPMAELLLGISVGFFMYAFVNKTWNKQQWVDSRHIFWIGVIILIASLLLFFINPK